MSDQTLAFIGVILAWVSREIIPLYLKNRKPNSIPPTGSSCRAATSDDVARLERQVETLAKVVGEVRDWMLQEIGKASKNR